MTQEERRIKAMTLEMNIVQAHKSIMLRLLKVQQVPHDLVLEYFAVKSYTDCMDVPITAMDLFYICRRFGLRNDPFA